MRRHAVLWLVALAVSGAAAPASAATMSATPSTGLAVAGQMVQVDVTGLSGEPVYVVETARGDGVAYCNPKVYTSQATELHMPVYVKGTRGRWSP